MERERALMGLSICKTANLEFPKASLSPTVTIPGLLLVHDIEIIFPMCYKVEITSLKSSSTTLFLKNVFPFWFSFGNSKGQVSLG